jgi:hypothetical protein
VVEFCEHCDEPSGSIECGEYLDWLSVLVASQEGLCSMELLGYILWYIWLPLCFKGLHVH